MKRVLAGFIMTGHAGGVDKYMMQLAKTTHDQIQYDFLTNHKSEELETELSVFGIQLFEVPSLKHFYGQYKAICDILSRESYDAVYLNASTAISLPLIVAGYVKKIPLRIVHSHSSGVDTGSKRKRYILTTAHTIGRFFIRRMSNRYLACSNNAANWMFGNSCMKKRQYTFVPNGVSFSKYLHQPQLGDCMRKELGIEGKLILGHISNFQPVKNTGFLIDILKNLTHDHEEVMLLLIGDGPELKRTLDYAEQCGLRNKVLSLGYQNDVAKYYQIMDWFLLPSFFEGLSLVGVEAQVAGAYTLFSDTISNEGIISKNAVRLSISDSAIWAEYIRKHPVSKSQRDYLLDNAEAFNLDHLSEYYVSLFK